MLIAAFIWILILLGHLALACVLFNHVHARSFPTFPGRKSRKLTEKCIALLAVAPFPVFLYMLWNYVPGTPFRLPGPLRIYGGFAQVVGCYFAIRWVYRTLTRKLPNGAREVGRQNLDIGQELDLDLMHRFKGKVFGLIPGNETTNLSIHDWEFSFPQLPADLDGFKICQLSDLHFTGLIGPEYFQRVVEYANKGNPDLTIITGDLMDTDDCLDWIEKVLVHLKAKHGVYYILGNHDRLITRYRKYRGRLARAGLIAASSAWHSISVGKAQLILTGNELPWYDDVKRLPDSPSGVDLDDFFTVLLSHSPDQIGWAVQRKFDLMFAGHTHGGQIRIPFFGPIIAPSHYGIKYASGTFQVRNTMMHVSRGLSGDEPIRLNCPPELGFFTLRKGEPEAEKT